MLSGELTQEIHKTPPEPKWVFESPAYHLDLDGDGRDEVLKIIKRDGVDWLDLRGHDRREVFSGKLWAMGSGSRIYRLRLVDLSAGLRVLLIYLYEGQTEARRFEATARLYFLTLPDRQLKNLELTAGPRFWHEFAAQREQYGRRAYSVNLKDYDGDGTKDVGVEYNRIQSIWRYQQGSWVSL